MFICSHPLNYWLFPVDMCIWIFLAESKRWFKRFTCRPTFCSVCLKKRNDFVFKIVILLAFPTGYVCVTKFSLLNQRGNLGIYLYDIGLTSCGLRKKFSFVLLIFSALLFAFSDGFVSAFSWLNQNQRDDNVWLEDWNWILVNCYCYSWFCQQLSCAASTIIDDTVVGFDFLWLNDKPLFCSEFISLLAFLVIFCLTTSSVNQREDTARFGHLTEAVWLNDTELFLHSALFLTVLSVTCSKQRDKAYLSNSIHCIETAMKDNAVNIIF